MASVINQIKVGNIEYAIAASAYAECSTAAATAAKVATICTDSDTTNTAFTLVKGVAVNVKFTNTNSATNPTLNINNTGAKAITSKTSGATSPILKANHIYTVVYDGTHWVITNTKEEVYVGTGDMPADATLQVIINDAGELPVKPSACGIIDDVITCNNNSVNFDMRTPINIDPAKNTILLGTANLYVTQDGVSGYASNNHGVIVTILPANFLPDGHEWLIDSNKNVLGEIYWDPTNNRAVLDTSGRMTAKWHIINLTYLQF